MMTDIPQHKKLVLFDGVCNLCNSSVQFIIKRDKNNVFLFTPLQSESAKQILRDQDSKILDTDSILLYEPDKGISIQSTAALRIARSLGFPINILAIFLIVPPFLRNAVYNFIAKNRYKWYGRRSECMMPSAEISAKFLK